MILDTVDFKKMIVSFCGMPVTGWGTGNNSLSLEVPDDGWKDKTGNSGDFVRIKVYNNKGMATLKLLQVSPYNDFLSRRYLLDRQGGIGYGEFVAKAVNGATLFMSPTAYVQNIPKAEEGDDANEREWKIVCPNVQYFLGGNVI